MKIRIQIEKKNTSFYANLKMYLCDSYSRNISKEFLYLILKCKTDPISS